MYWDGEKQTYLPAPMDETGQLTAPGDKSEDGKNRKDNKDNKKEKVKIAKKIAKVCSSKYLLHVNNGEPSLVHWQKLSIMHLLNTRNEHLLFTDKSSPSCIS